MNCFVRPLMFGLALTVVPAYQIAASNPPAGETPKDPIVQRLANVDVFAFGGVGRAGSISQGEKDYRLILARTSATADFKKLFAVGNAQARSYALVALYYLDHKEFVDLSLPLRDSKADVKTMAGCFVLRQSLSDVIGSIEAGDFLLQAPARR